MVHLLTSISRFTLIIWFAFYTYECFAALKNGISEQRQNMRYHRQTTYMYFIIVNANLVLYMATHDMQILLMCTAEIIFFIITMLIYNKMYQNASKSIVNNMCMLLAISFIILTRLDIDKAMKQFAIAVCALIITCLIPLFIHKLKFLNKLTWIYAIIGILGLGVVAVAGSRVYGAKLNISLGPVTIQPSEFVKILFVFFVASMLYKSIDFHQVVVTTIIAALHVLILVASKDLGGAGIFLFTYLIMLYVATKKPSYMLLGIGASVLAAFLAYFIFPHVQTRVIAWRDPLSVANDAGYQICQSLFAIGTGGWFGSGLYLGMPQKIPVATSDFVFSAISEEMGAIFALCLIFVCISCFLMFLNIAMQVKDQFYKLIALGLGCVYGLQVFITLGGVIKFIPSTGVTLPLVSYGGSSLLSTMILFAIIQGLYVIQKDNGDEDVKKKHR